MKCPRCSSENIEILGYKPGNYCNNCGLELPSTLSKGEGKENVLPHDQNFTVKLKAAIDKRLVEAGVCKSVPHSVHDYTDGKRLAIFNFIESLGSITIESIYRPQSPSCSPSSAEEILAKYPIINVLDNKKYILLAMEDYLAQKNDAIKEKNLHIKLASSLLTQRDAEIKESLLLYQNMCDQITKDQQEIERLNKLLSQQKEP